MLVLAAVAALPVAFTSSVALPVWTPRLAILTPVAVAGLATLWWRRDRTAVVATLFLLAVAASVVSSGAPVAALLGPRGWYVGGLPILVAVGCWAAARGLSPRGVDLVAPLLVLGGALNAVAAMFQALLIHPLNIPDSSAFGRSAGFLGNPVNLAVLLSASLAVAAARAASSHRWHRVLAVAVIACGINLAGGRAGLAAAIIGLGLALRRASWFGRLVVVAAVVVGLGAALAIGSTGEGTTSATSRAGDVSASGRPGAWEAGLEAAIDRPLLGWGPGRFVAAAVPRRSLESRQVEPAPFVDAHNWPVEYLATIGFGGTALLLAWLALAGRDAAGPLAMFAAIVALGGLLQPASPVTTPLALVALGAAARRRAPPPRIPVVAVPALVGVCAAVVFVVAHVRLSPTTLDSSTSGLNDFDAARALLPDWPDLLREGAVLYDSADGAAARREALSLAAAAATREPGDVDNWGTLARMYERVGDTEGRQRSLERALVADPWSLGAMRSLAALHLENGENADAARLCRRAHQLRPRAPCP